MILGDETPLAHRDGAVQRPLKRVYSWLRSQTRMASAHRDGAVQRPLKQKPAVNESCMTRSMPEAHRDGAVQRPLKLTQELRQEFRPEERQGASRWGRSEAIET